MVISIQLFYIHYNVNTLRAWLEAIFWGSFLWDSGLKANFVYLCYVFVLCVSYVSLVPMKSILRCLDCSCTTIIILCVKSLTTIYSWLTLACRFRLFLLDSFGFVVQEFQISSLYCIISDSTTTGICVCPVYYYYFD